MNGDTEDKPVYASVLIYDCNASLRSDRCCVMRLKNAEITTEFVEEHRNIHQPTFKVSTLLLTHLRNTSEFRIISFKRGEFDIVGTLSGISG